MVDPKKAGPESSEAALKALELDSTNAEVHYALATNYYATHWDWEKSESEFKKTFELNPSHAEARAYYSHLLNFMKRPEEALKQIETAMEMDPYTY